jgi:ArsR family transcriptional regulator
MFDICVTLAVMANTPNGQIPNGPTIEMIACCAPAGGLQMADAEATALALAFKAIGHPVRVQMLDLLSRSEGQLCVCELETYFPLSQSTISHHLRVLREADLVGAEQRGLWAYYYVRRDTVAQLRERLTHWATVPER